MKKKLVFILITFILNIPIVAAVENITVSDNPIFSPDSTISLEPQDNGLNLGDFLVPESQITKVERSTENFASVGFMLKVKRKAYVGAESEFEPIPIIEGKYDRFFIKSTTLESVSGYIGGYNFYSDRQFVLSGTMEYHIAGQDAKKLEYPYNQFIPTKDSEFYFGISSQFIPEANPEFALGIDVSKNFLNSGGLRIKAYGERFLAYTPELYIVPAVSYEFLNKDYCNYYYAVPSTKYNIPSYKDVSGGKFGVHLDLVYKLGENMSFRSINNLEIFSNEIASSTLIASRILYNIGLGLSFNF